MKSTPSTGFQVYLSGQMRCARKTYRKRLERCRKKFSEKSVHRLRIETRRLLALLNVLKQLPGVGIPRTLPEEFRNRLNAFDKLRDTQVAQRLLKPLWDRFPEAQSFRRYLVRREDKLVSQLAKKIKATRLDRVYRKLKKIEQELGEVPRLDQALLKIRAYKVVQTEFEGVSTFRSKVKATDLATLHHMRIAFKQFRYSAEWMQPVLAHPRDSEYDSMKKYQDCAGDIQDLQVVLWRLARVVRQRRVSPSAIRNLREELRRRKQAGLDRFMARIDQFLRFRPQPESSLKQVVDSGNDSVSGRETPDK